MLTALAANTGYCRHNKYAYIYIIKSPDTNKYTKAKKQLYKMCKYLLIYLVWFSSYT